MSSNPKVNSYVTIRQGCPMRFRVNGSDEVEFSFGGLREPFEFVFDAESLRDFLKLGNNALQKLEAQAELEQAENTPERQPC